MLVFEHMPLSRHVTTEWRVRGFEHACVLALFRLLPLVRSVVTVTTSIVAAEVPSQVPLVRHHVAAITIRSRCSALGTSYPCCAVCSASALHESLCCSANSSPLKAAKHAWLAKDAADALDSDSSGGDLE